MSIPRIIHQTVRDKEALSGPIVENIKNLKCLNDGWSYRLYDDTDCRDFIEKVYGSETLAYFDRINPLYGAARADLFRYLLLYELGGVYLDIKSTATLPLNEVLRPTDSYLLSSWNGKTARFEYQQWHIVASPKHPFLKAVIEAVKKNIDGYNPLSHRVGKNGVLELTGPVIYTSTIRSIEKLHEHRVVDIEDLGFRYTIIPTSKTDHRRYGHEELFPNHYSDQVEPIINREYDGVEHLMIGGMTQYRTLRRELKKMVKRRVFGRF
jgi:inositol phosphorylceramide mannosyltransferase catalytic subunit